MARLVDARAPLLPLGYRAGLLFCKEFGDWRRAMVLMEDMRVAKRRPSGECLPSFVRLRFPYFFPPAFVRLRFASFLFW